MSCRQTESNDLRILFACAIVKKIIKDIKVAIASGFHLFPFRTEKLSPTAPMVLPRWESRSLPFLKRVPFWRNLERDFCVFEVQELRSVGVQECRSVDDSAACVYSFIR